MLWKNSADNRSRSEIVSELSADNSYKNQAFYFLQLCCLIFEGGLFCLFSSFKVVFFIVYLENRSKSFVCG